MATTNNNPRPEAVADRPEAVAEQDTELRMEANLLAYNRFTFRMACEIDDIKPRSKPIKGLKKPTKSDISAIIEQLNADNIPTKRWHGVPKAKRDITYRNKQKKQREKLLKAIG